MEHARAAYDITARIREHHAKEVFDPKRVRQAIETRAADGYRDLRIVQKHPFDLSRSAPARALETWLEDNQYRYVWSPVPPSLDPLRSALSEDYPELAIFW